MNKGINKDNHCRSVRNSQKRGEKGGNKLKNY